MTDHHRLRPPIGAPATAIDELLAAMHAAQSQHNLFPLGAATGPTPVVIGVSGGVDSIVLLHTLVQLAGDWRLALHVAHLDHALRPDSAADAAFVARCAADWGVAFYGERLAPGALLDSPDGLEAAARLARYAFLAKVAINVTPPGKVPIIAVAHHADDQAETLLLHLVRGAGLQGLGAMRYVTELEQHGHTVRLVRPLLGVRRATILAYAATQGLTWCEDPTNTATRFLRNQLRHEILPRLAQINPNIVATLGRTADVLAADYARLAHSDDQTLQRLSLAEPTSERVVLDLDRFLGLAEGVQRGVLRRALARLTPQGPELGFGHIETLLARLRQHAHAGGPYPLAGDLAWTVAGSTPATPLRLSLHRAGRLPFAPAHPYLDDAWRAVVGAAPLPQEGIVDTPGGWQLHVRRLSLDDLPPDWRRRSDPWVAYLDVDQVGEPVLTSPHPGQHVGPLGMGGHRKSLGDLFTDAKIPTALRGGWPLILDRASDTILWVCGLAVAHTARIAESTSQLLRLQWRHPAVKPCAPT